jgi:aldehyde dehydrogenase (NAD+)
MGTAALRQNTYRYASLDVALGLASCEIDPEPLGLALVISAWNYPIYTSLPQVAAAISAGNAVILKPSELSPYCSKVLAKLFQKYMDPSKAFSTQGSTACWREKWRCRRR